ncbi:nucleotidyltransferase domain-containing protein [Candidatus Woesearchaeota archaeon]|nr:nucleotidyltransferase domain-containing protein [Candidatus Woesearchaeota archaeon]
MVQGANKNIALVKKFKRNINKIIKIDKLIFYGSRAKGNFHRYSDFDLLIVSPDFKEIPWYKRPVKLYLMWKEDYPLEILCYTPDEVKKMVDRIGIVSEAYKKGIEI